MTDDIIAAIHERRSVRSFHPEIVPREQIEALLEAAVWAPSGVNAQPWRFLVVTDQAILAEVNRVTKRFIGRLQPFLPLLTRVVRDLKDPDLRRAVRTAVLPKVHVLHGAPVLVLIYTERKPTNDERVACAMAAQNILLLAQTMGLGTCVLGITNALNFVPAARRVIGLNRGANIAVGMVMGYPQKRPSPPFRRPPQEVTRWL